MGGATVRSAALLTLFVSNSLQVILSPSGKPVVSSEVQALMEPEKQLCPLKILISCLALGASGTGA